MIHDNNWCDLKDLEMSSIERDLWPVTSGMRSAFYFIQDCKQE